jgi:hypothetical protein
MDRETGHRLSGDGQRHWEQTEWEWTETQGTILNTTGSWDPQKKGNTD